MTIPLLTLLRCHKNSSVTGVVGSFQTPNYSMASLWEIHNLYDNSYQIHHKDIKPDVPIPVMQNSFERQCPNTLGIFHALNVVLAVNPMTWFPGIILASWRRGLSVLIITFEWQAMVLTSLSTSPSIYLRDIRGVPPHWKHVTKIHLGQSLECWSNLSQLRFD